MNLCVSQGCEVNGNAPGADAVPGGVNKNMTNNRTKFIISVSTRKNLQMVVYQNVGPDGRKDSITRFEPLCVDRPQYRRFRVPVRERQLSREEETVALAALKARVDRDLKKLGLLKQKTERLVDAR